MVAVTPELLELYRDRLTLRLGIVALRAAPTLALLPSACLVHAAADGAKTATKCADAVADGATTAPTTSDQKNQS